MVVYFHLYHFISMLHIYPPVTIQSQMFDVQHIFHCRSVKCLDESALAYDDPMLCLNSCPFCSLEATMHRYSSVGRGATPPPLTCRVCKIPCFLVLLRPIFAIKAKIAPLPFGIGNESLTTLTLDLKKNRSQKNNPNLGEDLFLVFI